MLALLLVSTPAPLLAGSLEEDLGRSEVRVRSAPFHLAPGRTVREYRLVERLEALGYRRVHQKPDAPGTYFWGNETFWIWRRAHRLRGRDRPAQIFGLALAPRDGMVLRLFGGEGEPLRRPPWLEPETLAESLEGDRARRLPVRLADLPDHVWQALLAAEDARFFDHPGVDGRALARALLANLKAGKVAQGGSTITQQLVKMRDLTPRRTLGRKVSEAVRALALEADHDKEEILQAYLNHVYYGHVEGLAVHGIGAAARALFSKNARDLDLAEAALLAALVQGPNRLSPVRHPERAKERRDWVLWRLEELGWAPAGEVAAARRAPVKVRLTAPRAPPGGWFLDWVAGIVREEAPRRAEKGRGFVVETELDPELQRLAESAVRGRLASLRSAYPRLRMAPLQAALVALDAKTGGVLAHVGGDPDGPRGGFDRVRQARRQPGSTVKPLLLLEAFEACGMRGPLNPSSRVADATLRIDLPSGPWEPVNPDGRFRGVVTAREALRESLNIPFVRIARWCGYRETAARMRAAGLDLPADPPPSFALGAVEATPLQLARAYTVFATPGRRLEARPVFRVERPGGRRLHRSRPRSSGVTTPSAAWLVHHLMMDAVAKGTARAVALEGLAAAAKTGTSSERRDAWIAGHAGGIVAVAWVGRDDGGPLGLTGASAAGPLWRKFMEGAARTRPPRRLPAPRGVVERCVDPATGLLVGCGRRRAVGDLFRRDAQPPRKRFWRRDEPVPVVR